MHSIKTRCSERRLLQHSQPHARHGKEHTFDMSEALAVFQLPMSWLKALLVSKALEKLESCATFQLPMF